MSNLTQGKIKAIVGEKDIILYGDGYAEPGYKDPESGLIALANWNNFEREGMLLEKLGVETEWEDEWTYCHNCEKLVRTQPDSYCWRPYYYMFDYGDILCGDCILEDPEEYLTRLEGDPRKAITFDGIDLEEYGYKLLYENLENGFHGGQDDDPNVIAESLAKAGVDRFVFTIDYTGQFDIQFSVYVHESQFELVEFKNLKIKADISPAEIMKRGLENAGKALDELKGDGIRYAKIQPDGNVKARLVSSEEFIQGIKDD